MQEDKLASIKAMSAFSGVDIQVREIVDKWILLTYDLPVTKEGNEARSKFLTTARRIGAIKHTNSVYLMPWTPQAELLALNVSQIGEAFLWISQVKEDKVAGLTKDYDTKSKQIFKDVAERLDKIEGHVVAEHLKLSEKMLEKTRPMIEGLVSIATQRGSVELLESAALLKDKFDYLCKKSLMTFTARLL